MRSGVTLAAEMALQVAPVAVRVNPDVHSPTHEFTQHGARGAPSSGSSPRRGARALYRRVAGTSGGCARLAWTCTSGRRSAIRRPFLRALDVVLQVARAGTAAELGIELDYVDLGGGFGISRTGAGENSGHPRPWAARVAARLEGRRTCPLQLILEPGRFLVGDAGALLTRVLYVKRSGGKTFVVADAG